MSPRRSRPPAYRLPRRLPARPARFGISGLQVAEVNHQPVSGRQRAQADRTLRSAPPRTSKWI
jgi:hypothetical protein